MIVRNIDKQIYGWIMEVETMMLMKYKVQLVLQEDRMSMLDLQFMMQHVHFKNEEIEKSQGKDTFSKCLVYLRDMLNFMTLGDNRMR